MRNNFLFLLFGLILIVTLATVACERTPSGEAGSTPATTIRIGYRPKAMLDVTPVVIQERGMSMDGASIELVPLSSPQDGFAKFAANEVDVLVGLPLEAIIAQIVERSDAVPFRIYALQADSPELGWAAIIAGRDTRAERIADLRNQLVASLPTEQAEYLLRRILASAGVPEDEIETTRYSFANPLAGLAAGEHAALFGPDPAIALAISSGYRVIERGTLSRYLSEGRPFPVAASVISTDFLRQHPGAAESFLQLVDEATGIVAQHTDEVRSYFSASEYGGLDPTVCALLVFPLMDRPTPELCSVTNRLFSDLHRDGLLDRKVSIEPFLVGGR